MNFVSIERLWRWWCNYALSCIFRIYLSPGLCISLSINYSGAVTNVTELHILLKLFIFRFTRITLTKDTCQTEQSQAYPRHTFEDKSKAKGRRSVMRIYRTCFPNDSPESHLCSFLVVTEMRGQCFHVMLDAMVFIESDYIFFSLSLFFLPPDDGKATALSTLV